jgi:hypothetical protein
MFLAYIDESGDKGAIASGGSKTYVLACTLVRASQWSDAFDKVISFRRFLKARFDLPVRAEVKANHLLRNGGPFRELALSEQARRAIYQMHMRLQAKIGLSTFAVVLNKSKLDPSIDPHERAWRFVLQRLERLATTNHDMILVIHDEGEPLAIRRFARYARRAGTAGSAYGTGGLRVPFKGLLDDPVSRDSRQSYFLQFADLAAFAAFRRHFPPPPGRYSIVPQMMWDHLGQARFADANKHAGGVPGIVFWPK